MPFIALLHRLQIKGRYGYGLRSLIFDYALFEYVKEGENEWKILRYGFGVLL
jgi:hypothetical protein